MEVNYNQLLSEVTVVEDWSPSLDKPKVNV